MAEGDRRLEPIGSLHHSPASANAAHVLQGERRENAPSDAYDAGDGQIQARLRCRVTCGGNRAVQHLHRRHVPRFGKPRLLQLLREQGYHRLVHLHVSAQARQFQADPRHPRERHRKVARLAPDGHRLRRGQLVAVLHLGELPFHLIDAPPDLSLWGIDPDAFGAYAPEPTLVLDARTHVCRKLDALRCHRTQIGEVSPFVWLTEAQAEELLGREYFVRAPVGADTPSCLEEMSRIPNP